MKLPNDLIKATDYSKQKHRIIKEFECVNGKVVQHYALGGEHELTMQEIVDCLNALATIDCDLQTAYAYIQTQNKENLDLISRWQMLKCFVVDELRGDRENYKITENPEFDYYCVADQTILDKMQELESENE